MSCGAGSDPRAEREPSGAQPQLQREIPFAGPPKPLDKPEQSSGRAQSAAVGSGPRGFRSNPVGSRRNLPQAEPPQGLGAATPMALTGAGAPLLGAAPCIATALQRDGTLLAMGSSAWSRAGAPWTSVLEVIRCHGPSAAWRLVVLIAVLCFSFFPPLHPPLSFLLSLSFFCKKTSSLSHSHSRSVRADAVNWSFL